MLGYYIRVGIASEIDVQPAVPQNKTLKHGSTTRDQTNGAYAVPIAAVFAFNCMSGMRLTDLFFMLRMVNLHAELQSSGYFH